MHKSYNMSVFNNTYITRNPIETRKLGEYVASRMKGGEVLCLTGNLGSGKTTFISGVINYYLPGKRILSPTFIIVRHYYTVGNMIKNVIHVDLYRINNISQIKDLGCQESINKPDSLVLIEWADRLKSLLPKKRIDIRFTTENGMIRKIIFNKHE